MRFPSLRHCKQEQKWGFECPNLGKCPFLGSIREAYSGFRREFVFLDLELLNFAVQR